MNNILNFLRLSIDIILFQFLKKVKKSGIEGQFILGAFAKSYLICYYLFFSASGPYSPPRLTDIYFRKLIYDSQGLFYIFKAEFDTPIIINHKA
jgi:hypothetical protein